MERLFGYFVLVFVLALVLSQAVSCAPEEEGERSSLLEPIFGIGRSDPPNADASAYLVPISHLTSHRTDFTPNLPTGQSIVVPDGLPDSLRGELAGNVRSLPTTEAVVAHVSRTPSSVGLVPFGAVDSRVRMLSVNGRNPVGFGRSYPLRAGDAAAPDPQKLRSIIVGGDMVLDRGLPHAVYQLGYGLDFPMSGGYAEVTSRVPVESEFSEYGVIHEFTAERRGSPGAVREYLSGADLTLANFENPVLANATYHPEGTVFEGDLSLLPILNEAGIDGVTLANNHVLDAGEPGLYETISNLEAAGIDHTGAGENLTAAREPMIFDLDGTTVGVISAQNVPTYEWTWATKDSFGTAPLTEETLREDIARLEKRVDTVLVMPHWGAEYTATPEPDQVGLARTAVEAGADAVVGGHAHWAKGMEIHDGSPVYYGVGNFLFDQIWSEETSTGILVELTLYDGEVMQSKPTPYIVLDYGQPNFLTPEGGGYRALEGIYAASLGPEFGHGS